MSQDPDIQNLNDQALGIPEGEISGSGQTGGQTAILSAEDFSILHGGTDGLFGVPEQDEEMDRSNFQGNEQESTGVVEDPNAPDKFAQAYRKLQSEADRAKAESQKLQEQLQYAIRELDKRQDLAVLNQRLQSDPQLAQNFYQMMQGSINGQQQGPTLPEEPAPPNAKDFDFADPDQLRAFQERQVEYSKQLVDYNRTVLEHQMQSTLGPIQQAYEAQRAQEQQYSLARELYQAGLQRGLNQEQSAEMVSIFSQQEGFSPEDFITLYRARKGLYAATNPNQQQMAQQRQMQQSFPVSPRAGVSQTVDPVANFKRSLVQSANTGLAPGIVPRNR